MIKEIPYRWWQLQDFLNFHPYKLEMIQFDLRIFFKWVAEKTPTRFQFSESLSWNLSTSKHYVGILLLSEKSQWTYFEGEMIDSDSGDFEIRFDQT